MRIRSVALGMIASSLVACTDEVRTTGGIPTWEEFEASTYKEPWEGGVYIVDGDTPISTTEKLRAFYGALYESDGALAVNTILAGLFDDRFSDATKRNITYCVSSASFGTRYDEVVAAMAAATASWEAAANVNYVHRAELDASCNANQGGVVFDVRQVQGQRYLARAFFPSDGRGSRNVLIDTSSYSARPYTLKGILEHELGHTLGFRHEHTRPEAGVCFEDSSWRALTPYDAGSVMHYPQCNGTAAGDLALTAFDHAGAASLYGAPAGILWQDTGGNLAWWVVNGGTTVAERYPGIVTQDWQIAGNGDFDGDGGDDILWRNTDGQVAIWHMASGVRIGQSYPGGRDPGREWEIQGVGNFDGDAHDDVLWRHRGGGLAIWLAGDANRAVYPSYANQGGVVELAWTIRGAGDFNGDGNDDILWRHSNGQVALWHMDGGRWLSEARPGGEDPGRSWQIQGVGDFDADRRSDILWRDSGGHMAIWLRGDNTRAVYPAPGNVPGPVGLTWSVQGIADFDGDSKSDILWRETTGALVIWRLDGGHILGETGRRTVDSWWTVKGTFAHE
jgi:serralysin